MAVESNGLFSGGPVTSTLQRVFSEAQERHTADDLLYLERWEVCPLPGPASALRVSQIRRANPELALAIRREVGKQRR